MTEVEAKVWWKSSTMWINILGIIAIVLDFIIRGKLIPDADVITIAVAVLNIINRLRAPKVVAPIAPRII